MNSICSVLDHFFDRVCIALRELYAQLWRASQSIRVSQGEYDLVLSRAQQGAASGEQSAAHRAEFERLLHVKRLLASSRLPSLEVESLDTLARRRLDEACEESMRLAYGQDVLHLTVALPNFTSFNNNEVAIVYYEPGLLCPLQVNLLLLLLLMILQLIPVRSSCLFEFPRPEFNHCIELLVEEMPNRFSVAGAAKALQTQATNRTLVNGAGGGLYDPDVDVDNLVERKHHLLTRSARSNLKESDRNIKPSGKIYDQLRVRD